MTQPDPRAGLSPQQASAALLALEARVRAHLSEQAAATTAAINAALLPVVADATETTTGNQVVAHPEVYAAIAAALALAQQRTDDIITAAYTAAAAVALAAAVTAFAALGHDLPSSPPSPGTDTLRALHADAAVAYGDARTALQNDIAAGFDGISGPGGEHARVVAAHTVVQRIIRDLNHRITAGGVVAVHQGYTDTETALWRDYQQINPFIAIRKRWVVQSADPCEHCRDLDGVTVGLVEEFPYGEGLPVWGDLHGPPRHPNCRCRLAFDT